MTGKPFFQNSSFLDLRTTGPHKSNKEGKDGYETKLASVFGALCFMASAYAAQKPNILVIFGDDIGQANISA